MPILNITSRINALQTELSAVQAAPMTLRERVSRGYAQRALACLETIVSSSGTDEAALAAQLNDFLKTDWLNHLALPTDEITLLLCDIATWIGEREQRHPVSVLFPSVTSLEAIVEGYADLNAASVDVKTVIKTHVMGEHKTALLPVNMLLDLTLEADCTRLNKPYYNSEDYSSVGFLDLTSEAYHRLVEHSALTQSLDDAKRHYDGFSHNTDNLLGQLHLLCANLGINSVGGRGEETNAAGGVYSAIINFKTYYDQLDAENLQRIPAGLKQEIDLLLGLSSDPAQNINATETIATCIASRRGALIAQMNNQDAVLAQIAMNEEHKGELLTQAREQFEYNKNELRLALESGAYSGHDRFILTRQFLDETGVQLTLNSLEELGSLFNALSPHEISNLLQDNLLLAQVINQLNTLENLVITCIMLTPERLNAFLNGLDLSSIVLNTRDIPALLISLDIEKCKIVMESMRVLIKTERHLADVLLHLNPEQCLIVMESMKNALPELINCGPDLVNVLLFLNPEQREIVFEFMKEALPELIQMKQDLIDVLRHLSPEQCRIVMESMKEALPELIQTAPDLAEALFNLRPALREIIIEFMKDTLPSLIQTKQDLTDVLRHLRPDQCRIVIESKRDAFPSLIQTGRDLANVLTYLSPEQRGVVFESMKETLPSLIQTGNDLVDVLQYLSDDQRGIVLESMKEALPALIQTGQDLDLQCIIWCLPHPEQRKIIVDIKQLMDSLNKVILEQDITAFVSALVSDDNERIKTQFLQVINPSNPSIELITALSNLDLPWVNKINAAFEFHLIDTKLMPEQNTDVIKQYFDSNSSEATQRMAAFRARLRPLPDDRTDQLNQPPNGLI